MGGDGWEGGGGCRWLGVRGMFGMLVKRVIAALRIKYHTRWHSIAGSGLEQDGKEKRGWLCE